MGYFCLLLLALQCFFCYRIEKSLFSPSVSFTLLYIFIFTLSLSGLYGLYDSPDLAYELITLGVTMFVVGSMSRKSLYPSRHSYYLPPLTFTSSDERGSLISKRYWIMFVIVVLVISVSATMIVLFILTGGSVGDLYMIAAAATDGDENELTKDSQQLLLESYIAYPLLYLLVPVSIVEFFHTYSRKYLAVAVFLALIRVTLDARRTYLASFIMMLLLCVFLHRRDFKYAPRLTKKKMKSFLKYAFFLVLIFGFIFSFISQQRSIAKTGVDESSILQTMTFYYGASVQFFGDCIEKIKIDYTYGFSTFRGFVAPFFGVLKLFGLPTPEVLENANQYLTQIHEHSIQVSPISNYNSFATCFFQFYCDGGVLGIIILSFFWGFCSQYIYDKMLKNKTKRMETIYVFFYANILMLSFVNMETVIAFNFWPLVLASFLYTEKNINHKKEKLHLTKSNYDKAKRLD